MLIFRGGSRGDKQEVHNPSCTKSIFSYELSCILSTLRLGGSAPRHEEDAFPPESWVYPFHKYDSHYLAIKLYLSHNNLKTNTGICIDQEKFQYVGK